MLIGVEILECSIVKKASVGIQEAALDISLNAVEECKQNFISFNPFLASK